MRVKYSYGCDKSRTLELEVSEDSFVIRPVGEKSLDDALNDNTTKAALASYNQVAKFPEANTSIYRISRKASTETSFSLKDSDAQPINEDTQIRVLDRALVDSATGEYIAYSEDIFVKFADTLSDAECETILSQCNLEVRFKVPYATNAYFVTAQGVGLKIFDIALELLKLEVVEASHPELLRERKFKVVNPNQWHLQSTIIKNQLIDQSCNVVPAWRHSRGERTIIAIIDDGVETTHPAFADAGKVVTPLNATDGQNNAMPKLDRENHGTACAGVACASGSERTYGIAPDAQLMPIRLASQLGSLAEGMSFYHAAENRADVISCSWGPPDGIWWEDGDPTHHQYSPLPDSTRLAIDYAVKNGRQGKGCVITWAAGNGNESVENDGYASNPKVIAVAACNDRGERSVYSDYGPSIWCTFPSNDFGWPAQSRPAPLTPGIWTTDRQGKAGYNPGDHNGHIPEGDNDGDYTAAFGGTSSACPGVAGLAALALSINPNLYWHEVKELIKQSCVKIDQVNGRYDATGHSPYYGYGRPDALRLVSLAESSLAQTSQTHTQNSNGQQASSLRSSTVDSQMSFSASIDTQLKSLNAINGLSRIEDAAVRAYAKENVGAILAEAEIQYLDQRRRSPEAKEVFTTFLDTGSLEMRDVGVNFASLRQTAEAALWHLFCNVSTELAGSGEPSDAWNDLFNEGKLGREALHAGIVAVLAALGAPGGIAGSLVTGVLGDQLGKWIAGLVAEKFDSLIESKLVVFCAVVPQGQTQEASGQNEMFAP